MFQRAFLTASFCLTISLAGCESEPVQVTEADVEQAMRRGQVCGGFAGIQCPNPNQVCIDDPTDNCDPQAGGADCIGICVNGNAGGGNNGGGNGNGNGSNQCDADTDCRVFSNYCDGCECEALGVSEPDPQCNGTFYNCFVDPCEGLTAICHQGSCILN